ncbi:hypothetical protein SDC9_99463 [bioreactor metagenome]|uniref:Uncharacterized protein n=1 Tax=bioreactor metagenome TaxID=1076179 RepID=A0A645AHL7_9ZZZZ
MNPQEGGDMSRFEPSPDGIIVHTNKTLICCRCRYCRPEVGRCKQYERKPQQVLDHAGDCPRFKKRLLFSFLPGRRL